MSDTDPANKIYRIRDYKRDCLGGIMANTRWRRAPASDKQLRVLLSKRIKIPNYQTKGQASHIISILNPPLIDNTLSQR